MDLKLFSNSSLCVVGNLNRDIKTTPFKAGNWLLRDGEHSVDGIYETIGGGGANSAAIAAGLGAKVNFAACIGSDGLGARLQKRMQSVGVKCFFKKNSSTPTGSTINLVYSSGQRHFLSCHPNNRALDFESIDPQALAGACHLLRADIWFSDSMLKGGNRRLFELARCQGLAVSLDLNWDPEWGRAPARLIRMRKKAVREILPLVDLAHGNMRELCEFADAATLADALKRITQWGAGAVVVHLGSKGAGYYSEESKFVTAPSMRVKQPLIATGTGDVLSVCMILLHERKDLAIKQKLTTANRIVAGYMSGLGPSLPPF